MYYVYVLEAESYPDKTYLGYTSDLRSRLTAHNTGKVKSTKGYRWTLIYYEAYMREKLARDRERKLKRNPRMKKFLFDRIYAS